MRGHPLIEGVAVRWNETAAAHRALFITAAVGAAGGGLVSTLRLHLGLPGHQAVLWMAPTLACRIALRHRAGAAVGAFSAAVAVCLLRGHLMGGGALSLLFAPVAGAMLDRCISFGERRSFPPGVQLVIAAAAGCLANLFCAAVRLAGPVRAHGVLFGLDRFAGFALSYALFGLVAGLLGAGAGIVILVRGERRRAGDG